MLVKASLFGATAVAIFFTPIHVDAIERRAADGETRTRTIEASRVMELVDMKISFNGEEIPAEQLGEISGTSTDSYSAVIVDAFEKAEGGRATKFTRTYEKLEGRAALEGGGLGMDDSDSKLSSGLAGEKVIFTFDAEHDEYTPSLPEGSKVDTDLLEDLIGDIEFAGLLPEGSVETGAQWDIDLDVFKEVIEPGGEMHLAPDDDEASKNPLDDTDVEPVLDGSFKGKLESIDDTEAGRVATITLDFDLKSHLELTDGLEPINQEGPMGEMTITPISIVVDRDAKGTGKLLWNLDRGCLVSFEMQGDVSESNSSNVEIAFGDQTFEQEQQLMQEGVFEISYSIE